MYVQAPVAVFPISFSAEEYPEATYRTPEELAADVEFIDDTESYLAYDATSRRVRLLVLQMELLLGQIVPDEFSISTVGIKSELDPTGTRLLAEHELLGNVVLRTLLATPTPKALPEQWSQSMQIPGRTLRPSQTSPRDFDVEWQRIKDREMRRKSR